MKKLITEFIGSFFLIFTVGMTVIDPGAGPMAPLAIGLVLGIMVYAGGHISGGHYNPAVTFGVWLRKKIQGKEAVGYVIVQLVAALVAAFLVRYLKGDPLLMASPLNLQPMQAMIGALVAEFLGTFALVYVVLNTATSKATAGNSYYGLAIGLIVTVMAYAVGYLSGGAFNPAVAVGISTLRLTLWSNLWIYLVGNFGGAFVAAKAFKFANPSDK